MTGFWSWFTTVDHKKIGLLYGVTAFVFFIVGGLEALLIRSQLAQPDGTVLNAEQYNEIFTMHGAHDDLPVRDADVGRVLQLPDPVDDRRARRRVPADQRVQLLAVPVRRAVPVLQLVPRRRAERRLVRLRAELHHRPDERHDVLRARPAAHRHRLHGRRRQPRRHDHQHARAGHVVLPDAGVRVDGARDAAPAGVLAADHHGRRCSSCSSTAGGAPTSSIRRPAATRSCGSTCSGCSATPRSTS